MNFYQRVESNNLNEIKDIADHNFIVETQSIKTEYDQLIPDHVAVIREDNQQYLGTVGKSWTPVQPETIYELGEKLIESIPNSHVSGIVNMMKGSIIGIEFKLASREYIVGDSLDINFLMLTSFNGMYGISGQATMTRLINDAQCNTSSKVYNLRHTRFVGNRLNVVKNMLKYYYKEIKIFDDKMMKLVNKRMNMNEAVEWFRSLFPVPKTSRGETKLDNEVSTFIEILNNSVGGNIIGVKGTSYGAFQALTEYINNHRRTRIVNGRDENEVRFQSVHFGSGNALAQKALNKLTSSIVTEFSESDFMIE